MKTLKIFLVKCECGQREILVLKLNPNFIFPQRCTVCGADYKTIDDIKEIDGPISLDFNILKEVL